MRSFRDALEAYERAGSVVRIGRAVEARYELAAVLQKLGPCSVGLIERVRGHTIPVAGNLLSTRERIAAGLQVDPARLLSKLVDAITTEVPSRLVDEAPCQEAVVDHPDIGRALPVPTFFERETGPYITAGVIIARHPLTGRRNVSIARAKVLGGNRLMLGIAPNHHLARLISDSLALGQPLPIAITIGNAPALLMASSYYVDYGHDEYSIAGALLGEPVSVARARTVALEVPADTEIVLEGTVGTEWVEEGPVSEFHGMYEDYGRGVVATISTLTHRRDAIFQAILPGRHAEHLRIGAEAIAATTFYHARTAVPEVADVHVSLGGCGRLQAIVALRHPRAGDAQKAVFAAWAHCNLLKHIVVVDADIDIRNPEDVSYALATRFRGEPDLIVVPGVRADRAEPLEDAGTVTKVGLVALCRPHGSRKDFTTAAVPADVMKAVEAGWAGYLGEPRVTRDRRTFPPDD